MCWRNVHLEEILRVKCLVTCWAFKNPTLFMVNFDVKFDIMWIGKCFVTELTLVGWCSWFVSNDSSFFIFIIWCGFRIFNRPKFLENWKKNVLFSGRTIMVFPYRPIPIITDMSFSYRPIPMTVPIIFSNIGRYRYRLPIINFGYFGTFFQNGLFYVWY